MSDKILSGRQRSQALVDAAKEGQTPRVRYLIDQPGVDLDWADEFGLTALNYAVDRGYEDTVAVLIAAGANVNYAHALHNGTALIDAAQHRHQRVVEQLLDARANVNVCDVYQGSALHVASLHGDEAIVRKLLSRSADVNQRCQVIFGIGKAGRQSELEVHSPSGPLCFGSGECGPILPAVLSRNIRVVNLLLEAGVDVNAPSATQMMSLSQSQGCYSGRHAWFDWKLGPFIVTPLLVAALFGDVDMLRLLLSRGADAMAPLTYDTTILHHAAWFGRDQCIEPLLKAGAAIHHQDFKGFTAQRENRVILL